VTRPEVPVATVRTALADRTVERAATVLEPAVPDPRAPAELSALASAEPLAERANAGCGALKWPPICGK
jgi:hypothetical protein